MSLIAQTTRRTLNRGSVIESGIPELTTGGRAEVGALIGGTREQATLPHINGYRRLLNGRVACLSRREAEKDGHDEPARGRGAGGRTFI
jgi:hypothetical protein